MEKPYEYMGMKAFWLLLLQNSFGAIAIFIIWLILVIFTGSTNISELSNYISHEPNADESVGKVLAIMIFAGAVLLVFAVLMAILLTVIDYFSFRFRVGEHAFRLKRGIINISDMAIPYRQIQDVNLFQPLIFQIFSASRVTLLTAGQDEENADGIVDHTEALIPCLDKKRALLLREELLRRSNIQEVTNVDLADTVEPPAPIYPSSSY